MNSHEWLLIMGITSYDIIIQKARLGNPHVLLSTFGTCKQGCCEEIWRDFVWFTWWELTFRKNANCTTDKGIISLCVSPLMTVKNINWQQQLPVCLQLDLFDGYKSPANNDVVRRSRKSEQNTSLHLFKWIMQITTVVSRKGVNLIPALLGRFINCCQPTY